MSLEAFVLLMMFVALPLLQYLRGARQRSQRAAAFDVEARSTVTRPPPLASVPPVPEAVPPPALSLPSAPPPRGARERESGQHQDARLDLHQAVRLMTILGPCRASRAYEWRESSGSQ